MVVDTLTEIVALRKIAKEKFADLFPEFMRELLEFFGEKNITLKEEEIHIEIDEATLIVFINENGLEVRLVDHNDTYQDEYRMKNTTYHNIRSFCFDIRFNYQRYSLY